MEPKKLRWCLRIKDGLKAVEPSERLSKSYLEQAKSSLLRAKKDFEDGDLLWTTVAIYYAEYYALYSFLQKIGVKCENHACSILAASFLLGEDKTRSIEEHKGKRIDAQYYMKVGKKEEISKMLQEAKIFIAVFDEAVANLSTGEIDAYRLRLKALE